MTIEPRRAVSRLLLGGIPTVRVDRAGLANLMVQDCFRSREEGVDSPPKLVFSSNGQSVALAAQDMHFRQLLLEADLIHADGQSVVFASWGTRTPLPERVATTDFFHDAARAAQEADLSFFMLGGSERQNIRAVEAVRVAYPQLRIVGRRNGYFDPAESEAICEEIRAAKADVLWVGLGRPLQEQWSVNNRERLRGVGWVKTCGGLFSFLGGDAKRAPLWMQNAGLEWLYRMAREPRRLTGRYVSTNITSMVQLLTKSSRSPIE